jgi:uncharacterized phage-like protein YoqJ
MTVIAATGHRPDKLGGHTNMARLALGGLATEYLNRVRPSRMIVGMALGWDQAVAGACVALDIPFVAAVPFEGQESRWPPEAQKLYRWLLTMAEDVEVVSAFPGARAMQFRNEWMVDQAEAVVALHDGSWGGTFNCVEYARKRGVPVENLWARWSLPDDVRALLGAG